MRPWTLRANRPGRPTAPRPRLRLETLEGRAVPAVIDVTLTPDGVPDKVLVRPMGASVDVVVNGALRHRVPDGTGLTVRIFGSDDEDTLTVHAGVRALVTFDGNAGADSLTVVGSAAADGIAVTANAVAINATRVQFSDLGGVTVNAGAGNDRVFVASTAAGVTTTVNGHAGDDTVTVGMNLDVTGTTFSATLDHFAGTLRINGGTGTGDRVTAADSASGAGHEYTLGGSGGATDRWGLDRDSRQVFEYQNLDSLTVTTTNHADRMDVTATQPGLDLRIDGGKGLDRLTGSNARNYFFVTGTNSGLHSATGSPARFTSYEYLVGDAGADAFYIGAGGKVSGRIDGGGGLNLLSYTRTALPSVVAPIVDRAGPVRVNLQTGTATMVLGGISGIRNVYGSIGNDVLIGDAAANRLEGRGGIDTIFGSDGADYLTIRTSLGRSTVYGGAGDDVVLVGQGTRRLLASPTGFLTIDAGSGADQVHFDDTANTTDRSYRLSGLGVLAYDGASRATFKAAEKLYLNAGSGDDTVDATGVPAGSYWWVDGGAHRLGGDTYTGSNAHNKFIVLGFNRGLHNQSSFSSFENLLGNAHNSPTHVADAFIFTAGASLSGWIDGGGNGADTLSYTQLNPDLSYGDYVGNVAVNLQTGSATAVRGGARRINNVIGAAGDDLLIGNSGANRLEGRGGSDRLFGGGGNDWQYGQEGDDVIYGGAGYDHAYGGPGNDTLGLDNEFRHGGA